MPQNTSLTRSRCYELFSQSTGLEIRAAIKRSKKKSGRSIS